MKRTKFYLLPLICIIFGLHAHKSEAAKYSHEPFADKSCDSCHESDSPGKTDLMGELPGLCFECHDEFEGKFKHSPSSLGACLLCHTPHESDEEHLLTAPTAELCYQCHDQMESQINSSANTIHPPAENDCTSCHNPHASDVSQKFLNSKVKPLCLNCHAEEGVDHPADFDKTKNKHHPVETSESCLHCHDPHSSAFDAFLSEAPMDLCLKCHGEDKTDADGKVVVGFTRLLQENPEHHGPIKEKNCSGCHNPHGSDSFKMLLADYPSGFYTQKYGRNEFALCYLCHDAEAMEVKETTTLTNFRNGKKNLHAVHVNRDAKGRTCRACHETHAGKLPHHIRESVPFGKINWPLKLQYRVVYTNTETGENCNQPSDNCVQSGGSCVACHARLTYNYLND